MCLCVCGLVQFASGPFLCFVLLWLILSCDHLVGKEEACIFDFFGGCGLYFACSSSLCFIGRLCFVIVTPLGHHLYYFGYYKKNNP